MDSYAGNMTFGSPSIDLFRSGRDRASLLEASVYNRPQIPEHSLHGVGYDQELSSDIQNFVIGCVRRGVPVFIAVAAVTLLASSSYAAVPQVVNIDNFHHESVDNSVSDVAYSSPYNLTTAVADISARVDYDTISEKAGFRSSSTGDRVESILPTHTFLNKTYLINPNDPEAGMYYEELLSYAFWLKQGVSDSEFFSSLAEYLKNRYPVMNSEVIPVTSLGSGKEVMRELVNGRGHCVHASLVTWWLLSRMGYEVGLGAYYFDYSLVEEGRNVVGNVNHMTPIIVSKEMGVGVLDPTNGYFGSRDDYISHLRLSFPTMIGGINTSFPKLD